MYSNGWEKNISRGLINCSQLLSIINKLIEWHFLRAELKKEVRGKKQVFFLPRSLQKHRNVRLPLVFACAPAVVFPDTVNKNPSGETSAAFLSPCVTGKDTVFFVGDHQNRRFFFKKINR
jgi:hypothetical protein